MAATHDGPRGKAGPCFTLVCGATMFIAAVLGPSGIFAVILLWPFPSVLALDWMGERDPVTHQSQGWRITVALAALVVAGLLATVSGALALAGRRPTWLRIATTALWLPFAPYGLLVAACQWRETGVAWRGVAAFALLPAWVLAFLAVGSATPNLASSRDAGAGAAGLVVAALAAAWVLGLLRKRSAAPASAA